MSVQAMAYVLDEVRGITPIERLVLLSIANHADKNGQNAWPSVATIAEEADVQRIPTVKAALRKLRDAGLITVEINRGGTSETRPDRRPNRYALPQMRGGTVGVPSEANGGTVGVERGDAERANGGTVGVPLTIPEPPTTNGGVPADCERCDNTGVRADGSVCSCAWATRALYGIRETDDQARARRAERPR